MAERIELKVMTGENVALDEHVVDIPPNFYGQVIFKFKHGAIYHIQKVEEIKDSGRKE